MAVNISEETASGIAGSRHSDEMKLRMLVFLPSSWLCFLMWKSQARNSILVSRHGWQGVAMGVPSPIALQGYKQELDQKHSSQDSSRQSDME